MYLGVRDPPVFALRTPPSHSPHPRGNGMGGVKVPAPQSTRFTDFEADWARAAENGTECKFVRKQHFPPAPPSPCRAAPRGKGGGMWKWIHLNPLDSRISRQIGLEPQTIARNASLSGNSTFTPPPRPRGAARERGGVWKCLHRNPTDSRISRQIGLDT